jgi:hypothetical protein
MDICFEVWNEIKPQSIKNCWIKSTLISGASSNVESLAQVRDDVETETDDVNDIQSVAELLFNFANSQNAMTAVTLASSGVTLEPTCSERNDLEEAFDEVVVTANEFGANNNFHSIKRMILRWLSMEETKFCIDTLTEEIQEPMSVDGLCGINSKNDMPLNEGDEEDCLGDFCQHQPSFDDINEIATKLKEISVTMDGWKK